MREAALREATLFVRAVGTPAALVFICCRALFPAKAVFAAAAFRAGRLLAAAVLSAVFLEAVFLEAVFLAVILLEAARLKETLLREAFLRDVFLKRAFRSDDFLPAVLPAALFAAIFLATALVLRPALATPFLAIRFAPARPLAVRLALPDRSRLFAARPLFLRVVGIRSGSSAAGTLAPAALRVLRRDTVDASASIAGR